MACVHPTLAVTSCEAGTPDGEAPESTTVVVSCPLPPTGQVGGDPEAAGQVGGPPQGVGESDADLLSRVSSGDLESLGILYDRHHDSVRQFVMRATAGGADADDITHEAFLTLATIAARYDGRASARPLLLGIAARLVRQHRRAVARFLQVLTSFAGAVDGRVVRTPEEHASAGEEIERFEAALAGLPEEKRLVVLLIEREGWSGEEVAEALRVPLNTVWTRLHYARVELRQALGSRSLGGISRPLPEASTSR
jgi:RNA polymerase sigma-70 factor (ECF subfamily)